MRHGFYKKIIVIMKSENFDMEIIHLKKQTKFLLFFICSLFLLVLLTYYIYGDFYINKYLKFTIIHSQVSLVDAQAGLFIIHSYIVISLTNLFLRRNFPQFKFLIHIGILF